MDDMAVLPIDFAGKLAPVAKLEDILVRNYLEIDWKEVL